MINIKTIKIGDKVVIHKPTIRKDILWWEEDEMDKYNGKTLTISKIHKEGINQCIKAKEADNFILFISKWCYPITKKKNKNKYIYLCPTCEDEITQDKEYVSPGYFGACLKCDEDFFKIELIKKLNTN